MMRAYVGFYWKIKIKIKICNFMLNVIEFISKADWSWGKFSVMLKVLFFIGAVFDVAVMKNIVWSTG